VTEQVVSASVQLCLYVTELKLRNAVRHRRRRRGQGTRALKIQKKNIFRQLLCKTLTFY